MRAGRGKLGLPGPPEPTLKIEDSAGGGHRGRQEKDAANGAPGKCKEKDARPPTKKKKRKGKGKKKSCATRATVREEEKSDSFIETEKGHATYFSAVVGTCRDTVDGGGAWRSPDVLETARSLGRDSRTRW
jgi:hypothetical protein